MTNNIEDSDNTPFAIYEGIPYIRIDGFWQEVEYKGEGK